MKVMIIAPYIYDSSLPEFTKNKTGFGIMVHNIANAIGNIGNIDIVLLTRVITNGESKNNFTILSHTWKQFFLNAKVKDWINGIQGFLKNDVTFKNRVRHFFYETDGGYVRRQIQVERPDIVHIHGIGTITESYIRICEEMNIAYSVTLHGLIGLNDSISAPTYEKQIEYDFLIKAENNNIPVSVISSGMKNRIEKYYLKNRSFNISVITNGTKKSKINKRKVFQGNNSLTENEFLKQYSESLKHEGLYPKIRDTYSYLKRCKINGKKILFFVGNITKNKNQIQAVEILKNDEVFQNVILVLWGREFDSGKVRQEIIKYKLENRIILGGFNDQMNSFWEFCDVNLFFSLNDGFGLPIIEGYMQGIPSVTFEDLDSTEDLYHPDAMLKIKDRSIESVTNTVQSALNKTWNSKKIIEVGNKFSIDMMANAYVKWYRNIIAQIK